MKTNLPTNIIDHLASILQVTEKNKKIKVTILHQLINEGEFRIKINHMDEGFLFIYCKNRFAVVNTLVDYCFNTGNGVTRWMDETKFSDVEKIIKRL